MQHLRRRCIYFTDSCIYSVRRPSGFCSVIFGQLTRSPPMRSPSPPTPAAHSTRRPRRKKQNRGVSRSVIPKVGRSPHRMERPLARRDRNKATAAHRRAYRKHAPSSCYNRSRQLASPSNRAVPSLRTTCGRESHDRRVPPLPTPQREDRAIPCQTDRRQQDRQRSPPGMKCSLSIRNGIA